jgi:hypothetical protein
MSTEALIGSAAILFVGQVALALANGFALYRREDTRMFLPPMLTVFLVFAAPLGILAWIVSVGVSFFVYPWYWVLGMFVASRIVLSILYHPITTHFDEEAMQDLLGMEGSPKMGWLSLSYVAAILYIAGFTLLVWWGKVALLIGPDR